MRRKIQIFTIMFFLIFSACSVCVYGVPEEPQTHTLWFFYNNVCASCHEEDKFYELFNRCVTSEEKKLISYEIRTYNLFLDADEVVYEKLLKESGKDRTEYELPVLVADGQWVSGYESMESRLHGILFEEEGKDPTEAAVEQTEDSSEAGEKKVGDPAETAIEQTGELSEGGEKKAGNLSEAVVEQRESSEGGEKKAEDPTEAAIEQTEDSSEGGEKKAGNLSEAVVEQRESFEAGEKKAVDPAETAVEQTGEPSGVMEPDLSDAAGIIREIEGQQAVLLFTTYSCQECEQAKEYLGELEKERDFTIKEFNIAEGENVRIFKDFLAQYGCAQEDGKVPAVFAGESALFGAEEIREKLPSILEEEKADAEIIKAQIARAAEKADSKGTVSEGTDGAGAGGSSSDEKTAESAGAEGSPGLPALFGAGLLSGFNPCSISMLLMLFSILLTSHASVLKNGMVYLAGKYIVYLGLGLGIYFAASKIDQKLLSGYSGIVNVVIIFLFLAAAVLNFLDFLSVRRNDYGKVRMQLPRALRRFNHKLIKSAQGVEGIFLTLLVLGLGAAVSVGEFFCTGQIYMASILYLLRSGEQTVQSFAALLLYVTAMSIPAMVIVVLIHITKGTGRVSEFMLNHMGAIKLLNSVLFVLFALYFILR